MSRFLVALQVSLLAPGVLLAATAEYGATSHGPHFEPVGSESGPPSEVVTALFQDRLGFVWIGSRTGLTLYDGHTFTSFTYDPSDATSISDETIRVIGEDRRGNLWVGTNTGGLNRLDRATWKFERFRHRSSDPNSLSHDSVYAIAEDGAGNLWIGTQRGLNRLDPESHRFETFLASSYIHSLLVDREGRLWVGTVGEGLHRRDPATGGFENWKHDPRDPNSLGDASVFCLLEEPSGVLWAGTNDGLDRVDVATGSFRHFRGLGFPIVTALARGRDGDIWAGTFGGGLARLESATGAISTFRNEPTRRGGLPSNRVASLLADASGALWVGTWGGGLSRVSANGLLLMGGAVPEPPALVDRDVTALASDANGGLWIGTRNGALFRKEPGSGAYRHYLSAGAGSILKILPVANETVWVGTSAALLRIEARSGETARFHHDPEDLSSIGLGFVPAILEDRERHLWIGTGEGGAQELSPDGRVLRRFLHDPGDVNSLTDNYVTTLLEDRSGWLWVGTRSGGLNVLDRRTGRVERYRADPSDSRAISSDNVTSILEDRRGRLWVATGGGGLNRVDWGGAGERAIFTRFTVEDGLVDNNVMALLEDDDGSLWLSTKRGLSRFAPDRTTFTNHFPADGLPAGEFESGAATRTTSDLYFGSVRWVASIRAGTPPIPALASPTVITSLQTESERQAEDRPPWDLTRFEIPYGHWFSIRLAVLDYTAEHGHAHAYRLGNGKWTDLGLDRTITLTDLGPGTYRFVGRGRNSQGVWTETSPPLTIRVVPPVWMTWWFRILLGTALVFVALASHRLRLSSLERRNRELLELQAQRERSNADLARAYERLQSLARRLEAAKEEERKEIARELHDELGPSLTAVTINLQLLDVDKDAEKSRRRIEDSIDLADRMMERIRDLSLDLRPPLLDQMGLVSALKGYLETQAQRTGIAMEVHDETPLPELPPEVAITAFRVAQEAVTNAIRHAGASRIVVRVEPTEGGIALGVEDNGSGFDVPEILEGPATGKRIGLLGMHERARMLGGNLRLDSGPGRGTRVRLSLPLEAGA